jgi:RNA polymerase sigma-70 factor (ECF subfamily)
VARHGTNSDREDLFQNRAAVWHMSTHSRRCRRHHLDYQWRERRLPGTCEQKHKQGLSELRRPPMLVSSPARDPRLNWIYQRITELDEVNRSLALLMLDGFSYRDMSQILGLSESNVEVKINRIKAALAAQLAKEQDDGL